MEKQNNGIPQALQKYVSDGTSDEVLQRYARLKDIAAQSDFGEFDRNLVVLDTETTGLSFNHDDLIQIAAARMVNSQIVEWYITFVNPGKPIPEEITHLTGISNADVADAPDAATAVTDLVKFIGDAYVVAHNVDFDKTMITKHPEGAPLLESTWIDSLDLARIALPRLKSHRLLDLVRAFECPISTHRADEDVASTCAIFRILMAAIQSMPAGVVQKIADLATVEEWSSVAVFKYFAQKNSPEGETAFSLRTLRRKQLTAMPQEVKKDAEALAMDPTLGLRYPTAEEIDEAFTEEGLVGRLYDSYEHRDEQRQMSQAVRRAFESSANLVVEAGTGVGKSMAYLVPAALMAKKNNITVGVATKTNALLDQLVFHELPALSQVMGELTYAPLKGFSHYPCLRRIEGLLSEGGKNREIAGRMVNSAPALAGLLSYIEQTVYDDIDALKIDYRSVPRWSITTNSHDCLRRKCPFYGQACFVHGARRQAECADIVVTNHSLLFCDLVADGSLLPTVRHWIVDEAHGAEAEARRAFSKSLEAEAILRLAQRVSSDSAATNPFLRVERHFVTPENPEAAALLCALTGKGRSAGREFLAAAEEFAAHMKDLLYFDPNRRSKGYDIVELWVNDGVRNSSQFSSLTAYSKTLYEAGEKLVRACQDLVANLEEVNNAADVQREIASIAMVVKEMLAAIEVIFQVPSDAYAYSATLCRKKDRVAEKLEALMVNMGTALADTLFARTHSVVFASATLAVDRSFTSFEGALGLNSGEGTEAQELCLASSYDFDRQMTVYVANDMPEPNEPAYLSRLQELLAAVHLAQKGSMLTLFTNRREMEQCYDAVAPVCKEADLRIVCQKWGVSVKGLRDEFLTDKSLSLFALKSFWEGFDAPGSTLRGVVIPKLPFNKPTDPLSCERAARDDAAWRKFVLPAAVIETKQAAGRLIRKADDEGVLILADKRLVTKSYGRSFLRSLPSQNIKFMSCKEIAAELAKRQQ